MFSNFLIGLREGLEAALVVGILVAYLHRSGRSHLLPRVWMGVGLAVVVSIGAGAALTFGPRGLTFEAQEAIGGGLSLVAVGFVTAMVLWMARQARDLRGELEAKVDAAASAGTGLMLLALVAVGREGLETALFLWAATKAAGETAQPIVGATLGLLVAIAVGIGLYRGTLRLNLRTFFLWSGWFLIVVAAGVASYGIHDLQEAAILPGLDALAFDVSAQIPPSSWYATLLKGTVNFTPATTWLQASGWTLYIVATGALFWRRTRTPGPLATTPSTPENPPHQEQPCTSSAVAP